MSEEQKTKVAGLELILDMWKEDCKIAKMRLDETSRTSPLLHAKYLHMLANAKLRLKENEVSQKSLLKNKWLYYSGKMDQEQLKLLGWDPDPFNGLKILKGDMDHYYDSDEDIQKTELRIEYLKTSVGCLSEILDNIKWRHQNIKNIIEWRKFESGS